MNKEKKQVKSKSTKTQTRKKEIIEKENKTINSQNQNKEKKEKRQFYCSDCNTHFWKTVKPSNPQSMHPKCPNKSNQIWKCFSLTEMFGKGHFSCKKCKHTWSSPNSTFTIQQKCHKCFLNNLATFISEETDIKGKYKKGYHECSYCATGECKSKYNQIKNKCPEKRVVNKKPILSSTLKECKNTKTK